jgi:predicted enzyme related to lactoylglutathione lyase
MRKTYYTGPRNGELKATLHTPNLAATLDRVASAGGECVFGPLELPRGIGTIALFTDSEGNRVGLHQPA